MMVDTKQLRNDVRDYVAEAKAAIEDNCSRLWGTDDAEIVAGLLAEIERLRALLREAAGSYRPLDMNWPT